MSFIDAKIKKIPYKRSGQGVARDTDPSDLYNAEDIWAMEQVENVYKALTQYGAKVILDLDDYWVLESGHIMYRHYHQTKLAEVIRKHIKLADWVTCTTEHLAARIRPLNANVSILQNEPYER